MKKFCLLVIMSALAVAAGGQTPTPVPVFKTYAEAMAAGKAASDKNSFAAAEAAYGQAFDRASTDDQRFDALIKRGGAFEKMSRTERTSTGKYQTKTKTIFLFPDAVAAYRKAAELPSVAVEKKAEAMMLIGEIYSNSYKSGHLSSPPVSGKNWKEMGREEFAKVINLSGISPDTKARSLIGRALAYNTVASFGRFDTKQVQASAKDLEAAFMTAGAADHIRADALKELAALSKRIGDVNAYFNSLDQITKLSKAKPSQIIDAYDAITLLFLENGKLAEARKAATEGLGVPKAEAGDLAKLNRNLATAHLLDPANKVPNGVTPQALKLANAELDKAVNKRELKNSDRAKILLSLGGYFQEIKVVGATETAIAQFQKVLALKGLSAKELAEAQYGIGEAYRNAGKTAEAIAAYEKVSSESGQFHSYAQQRIKALSTPAAPKN